MAYNSNHFPLTEFVAVKELVGGRFSYEHATDTYFFQDGQSLPTEAEIKVKLDELQPIHSMKMLRAERDKLLAETDWWTARAVDSIELTQVQKDYRQALRDVPLGAEPILENGHITNITWPDKP